MAKTTKKKTPARAKTSAASVSKARAPKPTAVPVRRSGPEKGISRSPEAVFARSLRDLEAQSSKLHRQAERCAVTGDKPLYRRILGMVKGLDKLIEKGNASIKAA